MKKILNLLLLITFIITLTGCDSLFCIHEYTVLEETQSTCTEKGYSILKCNKCEKETKEIKDLLPHDYSEWNILQQPTENEDGLQKRICNNCGYIEEKILYSDSYIDLDIIRFDYSENKVFTANTYEDLDLIYNACLLNQSSKITCMINFSVGNFDELLQKLVDNSRIAISYEVGASLLGNKLEFTFKYPKTAQISTPNVVFTQYTSSNYNYYVSSRTSDFDGFKINNSKYTYNVSTTEQLVYVLERKTKPVFTKNCIASEIYETMKSILREIVDDNMSDYDKVKAIHDWLILNVTYDNELLELVSKSQNIKEYKGFYLEGVFLDKKAVCEGIAKAFACMANIEGIPCVVEEGYQTKNPKGVGHAWNKVYIDNTWYILDATSDGLIINNSIEVLSYQFFLIDDKTMQSKYTGKKYNNLKCNDNYNYYEKYGFNYNEESYDYSIDSVTELANLIGYFNITNSVNDSIEFKINYNYGFTFNDDISDACSILKISNKFKYITNGNSIILMK